MQATGATTTSTSIDWTQDARYIPSLNTPFNEVTPVLLLGNIRAREHVARERVDHVISLLLPRDRLRLPPLPVGVTEDAYDIDDTDNEAAAALLHTILDETSRNIPLLLSQGKKILVHCKGGVSRSPSVILDYWLTHDAVLSFDRALTRLSGHRFCINPNHLFQRVLKERDIARQTKRMAAIYARGRPPFGALVSTPIVTTLSSAEEEEEEEEEPAPPVVVVVANETPARAYSGDVAYII